MGKNSDKIIKENKEYIIHWIEMGKTKTWIANYLGMNLSTFSKALDRAGIDYKYIKYQVKDIKEEEQKEQKTLHYNKIFSDHFDIILDYLLKNASLDEVSRLIKIDKNELEVLLAERGFYLKGMSKNETKSKQKGFKGPNRIKEILESNNIKFKQEYTFDDCRFEDTDALARFDFGVLNSKNELQYLIEYDGAQHTTSVKHWGGNDGLAKRQEHDSYKDYYCSIHNIPLIRIPYTVDLDSLNMNDLDPKYSYFVV